jgi:hypothetical protein
LSVWLAIEEGLPFCQAVGAAQLEPNQWARVRVARGSLGLLQGRLVSRRLVLAGLVLRRRIVIGLAALTPFPRQP